MVGRFVAGRRYCYWTEITFKGMNLVSSGNHMGYSRYIELDDDTAYYDRNDTIHFLTDSTGVWNWRAKIYMHERTLFNELFSMPFVYNQEMFYDNESYSVRFVNPYSSNTDDTVSISTRLDFDGRIGTIVSSEFYDYTSEQMVRLFFSAGQDYLNPNEQEK